MSSLVRVTIACLSLAAAGAVLAAEAPAQKPAAAAPKPAATAAAAAAKPDDTNKAFYALGVLLAGNLKTFALSDAELEQVKTGLADGVHGKAGSVEPQTFIPKLQELERTRLAAVANKEKEAGKAYIAKAAAQPGAKKTASGIVITTVKEGTGASPTATDQVKVHYEGKLLNGTVFDSSIKRNEPATFPLNGVIPCWTEAVQTMKVGGKSKVVCPSDLAYGDNGSPPRIGPGATLVFDIELLDTMKSPPAPPAGGLQAPAPPK